MLAIIGLILGVALALVFRPEMPFWLQPYLPIMIVAAMDAAGVRFVVASGTHVERLRNSFDHPDELAFVADNGAQAAAPGQQAAGAPLAGAPKKADPAAEARDYEAALNLFKANKIKDAAQALDTFVKTYPDSTLTPNAQYWLGNAHYSLRDCKKAIDAQRVVVAKWPQHPKAPDALANIITCQQELGDAKGAKATTDTLLAKYPDSPAAQAAKKRQKK